MSVYLMVTVMVANMQMEFASTKLDSRAVQDRYKARAACAEVSRMMGMRSGIRWENYTRANPYRPTGYNPPVTVWFTPDPRSASLLHMQAQCGEEFAIRVFRRAGVAEAQIFSALVGPDGMRLHSLTMSEATRAQITDQMPEDGEGGPVNEVYSPWNPLASPPAFVFNAMGELIPYDGGLSNRFVADMRGGLFALMSSDEGFGMYQYVGGQAWTRLPVRPQVSFMPATGSLTPSGNSYLGSEGETPLWDVARDGAQIWFAENLEAGPAAPSGASFLQIYNVEDEAWDARPVPPLALAPGQPERFAIKDVAAGEDGQVFLLTQPTTQCPRSRVVKFDGTAWSVMADPPRRYFNATNTLVNEPGVLPIDSIAVGTANTLFASSPAGPNLYAVSRFTSSGWDLGLEKPTNPAALPSRNFSSANEYRPLSVDAAGQVILGDQDATENQVMRGSRDDSVYTALPNLMDRALPGERVWSNIGGGVAGTSTSIFKTTAEF